MDYKTFYKSAYLYLLKSAKKYGLNQEDIDKYLDPVHILDFSNNLYQTDFKDTNSIEYVFCRLFHSLQNSSYTNFVQLEKNNNEQAKIFRKALYGFSPTAVLAHHSTSEKFIDYMVGELNIRDKIANRKNIETVWRNFLKGVYDAALALNDSKTKADFSKKLEDIVKKSKYKEKNDVSKKVNCIIKAMISLKIRGLGAALAADFLKESGIIDCGKPDVHIVSVIEEVFGEQADCLAVLRDIAAENKVSVYRVDKIIWLICTEKFYIHNKNSLRNEFISYINKDCS